MLIGNLGSLGNLGNLMTCLTAMSVIIPRVTGHLTIGVLTTPLSPLGVFTMRRFHHYALSPPALSPLFSYFHIFIFVQCLNTRPTSYGVILKFCIPGFRVSFLLGPA